MTAPRDLTTTTNTTRARAQRRCLPRAVTQALPAAALATLAATAAPAAFGQQMTVYGLLDVGITRNSNEGGASVLKLSSGDVQQSRLGFRGNEDLGNDLKAFFVLEHAFNADTGAQAGAQFWSRDVRIGLASTRLGTVSMGRQSASHADFAGRYNSAMMVYGPGYYSSHPGNYDRTLNIPVDNSVKYLSPSFGGFSFGAHYGFGEQAGNIKALRNSSAGVGYDKGPLSLGASYIRVEGPVLAAALLAAAANPFTAATPNDALSAVALGGSYDLGPVLLHGLFSRTTFRLAQNAARTGEIGMKWSVPAPWTFGADFSRTDVSNRDASMNILSVSAVYNLSKRTDLYTVLASEKVSGTNVGGTPLVAQLFSQSASTTNRQTALRFAIRHRF